MGKNKLQKFGDMNTYPHVFQYPYAVLKEKDFPLKGKWNTDFFHNDNPIILEIGCGKGEYAVGLASTNPDKNYIGIDIKGARMWTGAKTSLEKGLDNVAFIRTHIELINSFFAPGEIAEIWITFPDPQMQKVRKRLTSSRFLKSYAELLTPNGIVHLKTDSFFLYTYTRELIRINRLPLLIGSDDLYHSPIEKEVPSIRTYYEQQWLERGIPIKYLRFVCESRKEWIEPVTEIEQDNYRSFNRGKHGNANKAPVHAVLNEKNNTRIK